MRFPPAVDGLGDLRQIRQDMNAHGLDARETI